MPARFLLSQTSDSGACDTRYELVLCVDSAASGDDLMFPSDPCAGPCPPGTFPWSISALDDRCSSGPELVCVGERGTYLGGVFQGDAGSCFIANPRTGACTCPAGFTPTAFYDFSLCIE